MRADKAKNEKEMNIIITPTLRIALLYSYSITFSIRAYDDRYYNCPTPSYVHVRKQTVSCIFMHNNGFDYLVLKNLY